MAITEYKTYSELRDELREPSKTNPKTAIRLEIHGLGYSGLTFDPS